MRLPMPRITATGVAAAIGGGLAAVLLSMITLQRPPATFMMGFVAPLPMMIAALGFGWPSGVLALLVGALFIGAFDLKLGALALSSHLGTAALDVAVFLVGLGLPAVILARLAARADAVVRPGDAIHSLRPEERRLGFIVLAAALFATLSVGLVFAVLIVVNGGFEAFNAAMVKAVEAAWPSIGKNAELPAGFDLHRFASELVWMIGPLMAMMLVIFYVFNLWLAARTAQTSGLLQTPWTDIPRYLRLPRIAAILLAVALGLSFVSGLPGFAARIVSAALIAALALQGLAVVHALTRGRPIRFALLTLVYVTLLPPLFPWPLLFWGFLGVLDEAFSFRDRHKPPPDRPAPRREAEPPRPEAGPWGPKP